MAKPKKTLAEQRKRKGQTARELEVATGQSNEPLRGEDLSPTSIQVINSVLEQRGLNQRASLVERQAGLQQRVANSTPGTNAAVKAVNEMKGVTNTLESGAIKDIPITARRATNQRTRLFTDAEAQMGPAETGKPQYPEGYGWYFSHRRDLNEVAADLEHGQQETVIGRTRPSASRGKQEAVVNASAVMAAANSPDNEKAAVAAFGGMLQRDRVHHLTPAAEKKIGAPDAHVRPSDLTSKQLAQMTTTGVAPGVSPAPPKDARRGSTTGRNADAVGFLRGELGEEDIPTKFPAASQAKLESYRRNIMDAVPNSGVEDEYMARYQDRVNPDQGRLDLFGKQQSDEGILGSRSVEDTWMNAISSGQQLETIPGTKTSPAKNVSSDSQTYKVSKKAEVEGKTVSDTAPGVQGAAMLHAWNNARTTAAATALSKHSPTQLPSTGVQEVSWIRARQEAGKDAAHGAAARAQQRNAQVQDQLHAAQFDIFGGGGEKPTMPEAKRALSGQGLPRRPEGPPITRHRPETANPLSQDELKRNWSEKF